MSLVTNPVVAVRHPIGELTATQVNAVRSELLVRRAEHSMRLRSTQDQTITLDENGAIDVGLAFERFLIDSSRDALVDIDTAIARLDDGTYGSCETCRRPIAFERLEAVPHARCCMGCADPAPTVSDRPRRS